MISINRGLINSFIVLEHLRNNQDIQKYVYIHVECFQNCREHGLTFTINEVLDDDLKRVFLDIEYFETFCVYQHRNSDQIIINGKKNWSSMNGDLPFMADDKSKYHKSFSYNQHYKCAEWLAKKFMKIRKNVLGDKKCVED